MAMRKLKLSLAGKANGKGKHNNYYEGVPHKTRVSYTISPSNRLILGILFHIYFISYNLCLLESLDLDGLVAWFLFAFEQ